jgi:DNA invertase Pin-like site-specific DNA recombinase
MARANCEYTFTDKMTGKRFDRPELLKMLDMLRPGDILVVWRLGRIGRSLEELIETVNLLSSRSVELCSLKENIDTTTPAGRLMFHAIADLAEFERDIISERSQAGLEAARAHGRKGGWSRAIVSIPPARLSLARELYEARKHSVIEIMALTGFKSQSTFYKYVVNERK